jgi:hypothetical protein
MLNPIVVVIAREEVESQDIRRPLSMLKVFLTSPETARNHFEKIDIVFHGYDDDTRELFEIPEVRNFAFKLDEAFPYWFYFLSKNDLGLQALMLCFLPPYLTEEAKTQIFPERLQPLLLERWFPAMNYVCEFVEMPEDEIERLTNRVMSYIANGRLPHIEGIEVANADLSSN